MAHFFKSGNTFSVAPSHSLDIAETLPPGPYVVKFNEFKGFYLEIAEPFKLPSKIYGDTFAMSERILNTFRDRARNTGVMLVGEKGSGKTLLARKVAMDSDMPVLIINSSFTGDNFNSFMNSITQPCVVFFDEFEKIYDREHQEKMLTLLDGTFQSEKLFLITSNDKWKIDTNMQNRPGRILYMMNFSGLDEKFIREYCEDNLKPEYQDRGPKIVEIAALFEQFNFDMLSSFVEEINRYGEYPRQMIPFLNAKPEYSSDITYNVELFIGDYQVVPSAITRREVSLNTSVETFSVGAYFHWEDKDCNKEEIYHLLCALESGQGNCDTDKISSFLKSGKLVPGRITGRSGHSQYHCDIEFSPEEITQYLGANSVVYMNDDRVKVILTRKKAKQSVPYSM